MTPDGWRFATLGDYCQQVSERARAEELPVLSVSKDLGIVLQSEKFKRRIASDDISNYKRVRFGQFVYDPMLLWAGNVGRQRRVPEGVVSPAYTVFVTTGLDDTYFEYFLKQPAMLDTYRSISRGTNVRRQKALFSDFTALRFDCPPVQEQRKIAVILSSVDDAIGATQAVIDQLQVVKKALMAELLTRGLPGRHTHFKQTEIGEMPEEWAVVSVGDACERMFVGIAQAATHAYVTDVGVPIIRSTNVRPNRLRKDDILRINHAFAAEMRSKALRAGDVLSARTGYPGTSVVVPAEFDGAQCFTMLVSRPGPRLRGQYLCHLMNSAIGERIVTHGQAGGAQQNLNVGVFEQALIALPALDEQEDICRLIDAIYQREDAEVALVETLGSIKSALMSVLLTGEVRVVPDEVAA